MQRTWVVVLVGALALAGCGDDNNTPNPDGGGTDGSVLTDGGGNVTDGGDTSCVTIGDTCSAGGQCCSGTCDSALQKCIPPETVCLASGATCQKGTDCCTLSCDGGKCSATQCTQDGQDCTKDSACCSQKCGTDGKCASLGSSCSTLGNACGTAGCCSKNCQNGVCMSQGGSCNALADVCQQDTDCCSGLCNLAAGATVGTCIAPKTQASSQCNQGGEPCSDCGGCCSRVCTPTLTGGHMCTPSSGCRVTGDICYQNADCCGYDPANKQSPTCSIPAGSTAGTCTQGQSCNPNGNVCGGLAGGNTCGNAQENCCACINTKECCKLDEAGVPRCYGTTTCIPAGEVCNFSGECCGGVPCLPDGNGTLRCSTKTCQDPGELCTADSDCCPGLPCNIPVGQPTGTCGAPPPPPPDGGTTDMSQPDMAPPPGCSLIGQACSASQACCTGLTCWSRSVNKACDGTTNDCTCMQPPG